MKRPQRCTTTVLATIIPDLKRTQAFCQLLLALCASFAPVEPGKRIDTTKSEDCNSGLGKIVNGKVQQPPQAQFKRLHLLYVVSDVLMQLRHGAGADPTGPNIRHPRGEEIFRRYVPLTAAFGAFTGHPKLTRSYDAVLHLLMIWRAEKLVPESELARIAAFATKADQASSWDAFVQTIGNQAASITEAITREQEESSLALPSRHGFPNDPSAPWHDLPAANGLYMKRTRGYPLMAAAFPMGGFETGVTSGEPDEELKATVRKLQADMLRCYDKYTDPEDVQDIDAMGNLIYKDPERTTRNYWGWSREGIEKMRELNKYSEENATGYADIAPPRGMDPLNSAVDRARALAGGGRGDHGGFRSSQRGGGGSVSGQGRGGRGWRGGNRRW